MTRRKLKLYTVVYQVQFLTSSSEQTQDNSAPQSFLSPARIIFSTENMIFHQCLTLSVQQFIQ
jgi:hypothetical protein